MRDIPAADITSAVSRLCIEANYNLGEDVVAAIVAARAREESPAGRQVLDQLIENAEVARTDEIPLCQDCGLAVVFVELGQDAHIVGGDLNEAIAEGTRQGYRKGYLRKSSVSRPYTARVNTGDNTPAIVHIEVVPGDRIRLTVAPKGGGSENMSALAMLTPASGRDGVIRFVVDTVRKAGANPCPPTIVGVGIGGTSERAMILAKKSLLRHVGKPSDNAEDAELEAEILERINRTGIGPQGLGGRITSLAVHVLSQPSHMASLPVAVNLQCHSARHRETVL